MSRTTPVPITPAVLSWAMQESGFTVESLAEKIKVSTETITSWLHGANPKLTDFKKLATTLKRSPATFLLPAPPQTSLPDIQFRRPPGAARSHLSTVERHAIRQARRLQETASWLSRELHDTPPDIPNHQISQDADEIAATVRHKLTAGLNGSFGEAWSDSSDAWDDWRDAVEEAGVLVLQLSIGKESVGGFSLWDTHAPLIAVNTAWNTSARIFSLFHEFAHLVTRTSSACLEPRKARLASDGDQTERWCERFSASLLIPKGALIRFLEDRYRWHSGAKIAELDVAKRIATNFRVSLRASALRLIELGWAEWSLYEQIPPYADDKPKGGGGTGRVRGEIREDQYGERTIGLFIRGLHEDVLGRSDVLDHLDLTDSYLDGIERRYSNQDAQ